MANILQFLHSNTLFPTREAAIDYIDANKPNPLTSVIAEPIIVKYGTTEATASIILGIGTNSKYFYFDSNFLQEEINTINTTIGSTGTEITTIQTNLATLQALLNTVITASGLNSNGTYNPTVPGATSLANADTLLLNQINNLIANLNSGTQKAQPIISTVANNLIYSEIDNGIAVKVNSFSYEPTTGVLTLAFNNVATPYSVNLGLNVVGFQSITFDSATESLIIVYQTTGGGTQTVTVPVSGMFTKWDVNNPIDNAVVLTKTLGGTGGVDKLSGDVKIDTVHPFNILQKDSSSGALYVNAVSNNISFNGTSQNVTDKINSIAIDISNASANAVSNANAYTNAQIAQEVINRNAAISSGVNAANAYTDAQVSSVSGQLSNIQNVVIPAETAARQSADNALQAQINALPTIDTRITSGEVLNNGTLLRLHYGTSTNPTMGYFDIDTTSYIQNPDQKLTSGVVASDGSTLTINYGSGVNQGSIIIPTSTFMDNKYIVSAVINNGMDNPPNYHPTLTMLYNDGTSVIAHLDTLAGARGVEKFQVAPGGDSLLIETFDGTDFNIPLSDFLGNFSTSAQMNAQLALKQDKLIAGTNITIVGNTINSIENYLGTVNLVSAGGGMDFASITASGAVALGTPSTVGPNTSNAIAGNSHTHNVALGFNISDYPTTTQVTSMITNATSNVTINSTVVETLGINATNNNLDVTKVNLNGGLTSLYTLPMPIATNTSNGYMPYQDHIAIQDLQTNIIGLQSAGGKFIGQSFATKAALNAYVVPSTVNVGDFTYVQSDESQPQVSGAYPTTKYSWNGTTWAFVITINEASYPIASTTYLGLVKSSTVNGQSYVESDGTMSLNGYDAMNNSITNIQNNVTAIMNGSVSSNKADSLTTSRNFSIAGDIAAATVSFNGTQNVVLSATYNKVATTTTTGVVKAGSGLAIAADGTLSVTSTPTADSVAWANVTGKPFTSIGTTLNVATNVLNLNTTGVTAGSYNSGLTIDTYGRVTSASNIPLASNTVAGLMSAANVTSLETLMNTTTGAMLKSVYDTNNDGVVDKAAILSTARTIAIGGSATGSVTFDGSANVTINTTANAGTGINAATNGQISLNTTYIQNMIDASLANLVGVAPII